MQFEQKTITILDLDRQPVEVTAWQGVGTGLAYHHPIYKDEPQGEDFILVHANTGMCITKLTLPTEPKVQAFLEAVAALDPDQWNISLEEYWQRYYSSRRVLEMRSKVEAAHFNALLPRDEIYLFAEDEDDDPIANLEVKSENPATGEYTDLHTYESSLANDNAEASKKMLAQVCHHQKPAE
jgi:hypothetical protein